MFNILKREIRINKHGFPVIKLVRDDTQIDIGAASRNFPTVTEVKVDLTELRHASLAAELSSKLSQELGTDTKATTLQGYSKWTLEVLQQKFGGSDELESFMGKTFYFRDDEDMVRSAAIFFDQISEYPKINSGSVLQSVKESLDVENLSDAEEGSDNHEAVSSVVKVAMANAQIQLDIKKARTASPRQDKNGRFVTNWVRNAGPRPEFGGMTPELAKVVTDFPDRTDDIIEHIKGRYDTRQAVDPDFLRINLNNASPSLADGLL